MMPQAEYNIAFGDDLSDAEKTGLYEWAKGIFTIVYPDFTCIEFPAECDLIRWLVVSWFAEMENRKIDISAFLENTLGRRVEQDSISRICTISEKYHAIAEQLYYDEQRFYDYWHRDYDTN